MAEREHLRDALGGDQEARPADQALSRARRRALRTRAEQARATSTWLGERYLGTVAQSLTICGQAAAACTAHQAASTPARNNAIMTSQTAQPCFWLFTMRPR